MKCSLEGVGCPLIQESIVGESVQSVVPKFYVHLSSSLQFPPQIFPHSGFIYTAHVYSNILAKESPIPISGSDVIIYGVVMDAAPGPKTFKFES